jgi:hypothetical protein
MDLDCRENKLPIKGVVYYFMFQEQNTELRNVATKKRLQEAIEAGEVLKIIYQGGSQPGTLRAIAPINIEGKKVRARCFNSNSFKLFAIDKIIIIEGEVQTKAIKWQLNVKQIPHYESIIALIEEKRAFLSGFGWHIESNSNCLSLHRQSKNGKPLKGSDVSIDYEENTDDCGFILVVGLDSESHEENMIKRQRPWIVRGTNMVTKTFGSLDKAAEVFLERAKLLAPSK